MSTARAKLEALLSQTLRITANDGRTFIGTFACIDKQKNIIITNTDEYRIGGPAHGRYVAMVMVPWRLVIKVEAHGQARPMNAIEEEMYT